MSSQPRTYPPHGTDRDDEYPTETFRSVVDHSVVDHSAADQGDRDPREPGPVASDDDPPTQVMGALRDDAEPAAAGSSLFETYTGSDDEDDTAVFARFRDEDPDPRAAADPRRVAAGSDAETRHTPGSLPEQVGDRADQDEEPHTEQFAAYRDEAAPPSRPGSSPTGANPAAGRLPTGAMPPIPPIPPVVPPVPPDGAGSDHSPATRSDPADAQDIPADAQEIPAAAAAPAEPPAEDDEAEPTLDKRAARRAEKDAKAEAKAAAKAEKLAAKVEKKAVRRGEAVGPDDEEAGDAGSTSAAPDPATDGSNRAAASPVGTGATATGATAVAGAAAAGAAGAAGAAVARSATTTDPNPDTVTTGEIPAAAPAERTAETAAQAPVQAEAAPPEDEEAEPDTAKARRKSPVLVVIVLLLVAAAGAGAAVWFRGHVVETGNQRPSSNQALLDKSATAEAVEQVSRAVEAIYSYDAANLDADEAKALSMINGSYASEFKQNFAAVRALPPGQRASLSSKVVEVGVITLTERRASLLVMLDQVGRQADKPEPVKAAVRLSVTAQRVDGQWKVSGVNQK